MSNNKRVIIIGLDGVPFEMLKNFAENGVMPNTGKVISQSVFKPMLSSIPEVSSVAWSSMITGQNPGENGIYGFMDLLPNSYKMTFPNFNDLKSPPFWDIWKQRSIIMNVPGTYPVREMDGVHISGFVSIDYEKSMYPPALASLLKRMDYRLDVNSQQAHTDMDAFLEDVDKTIDARIEAYRYLWKNVEWQHFMLVFTCTDRLMHFLWNAYEDENHEHHDFFLDHFRKIDTAVGEILDKTTNDDILIMHSDHGFERLDNEVLLSYLLEQNGFLSFKKDQERSIKNLCPSTKAFVLDPARIYLHYKGKYPAGSVEPGQKEDILKELEDLLSNFEKDGKKVIRDIYRPEQIYSGKCFDNAPDLILVSNQGFDLKAKVKNEKLFDKGLFTGKHTQDTAFLVVKGLDDESIVPEIPSVSDIIGIAEKAKN